LSDFLAEMAAASRARVEAATASLADLKARAAERPVKPLVRDGFDLIAEIKLRAPSAGRLAADLPDREGFLVERAKTYADAGAAAISVLAEPTRFDGRLSDVAVAAAAVDVPVMRKDFLVDAYQVWEAAAVGAGGVLVIVRMLPGEALKRLADAAVEAGLFVLVEAFDSADLVRAAELVDAWPADAPPVLVGVNTRDLSTLQVDGLRLERLAPELPPNAPGVAESGLRVGADAARVARQGYRLALVGSALMQAPDAGVLVREMLRAGRAACR
jgi:indole-3-glycerol phosphate synthase